ncbi:hypothetical protein TPAR_01962, partial [Tolypocladium paradoxum]
LSLGRFGVLVLLPHLEALVGGRHHSAESLEDAGGPLRGSQTLPVLDHPDQRENHTHKVAHLETKKITEPARQLLNGIAKRADDLVDQVSGQPEESLHARSPGESVSNNDQQLPDLRGKD